MRCVLVLALCAVATMARADDTLTRALLSPTREAQAMVAPGAVLSCVVRAASGLTPPPGIQEDRALERFAAWLCAHGRAVGTAPARACFALSVTNVRPEAAHSLDYRVDVPLPAWLAPGVYDLGLRFPGASAEAAQSVIVGPTALDARVEADGDTLRLHGSGDVPAVAQLHVAGRALEVQGGNVEVYPLPDASGRLQEAFIARVFVPARAPVRVRARASEPWRRASLVLPAAESGQRVELRVRGAPDGAAVFWWLGPSRGGVGPSIDARFVAPGSHPVAALIIDPARGASLLEGTASLTPRRVGACSALPARPAGGGFHVLGLLLGLLVLAVSWKLGPRRGRRGPRAGSSAA